MRVRPTTGLALLPFAAACLLAAACAGDATGPGDAAVPSLRATAAETCSASDSVVAGYGCCATGGLEYTEFEYDPATGTEYVATCDPEAADSGMTTTPTSPPPTSPTPTPTSPTPTR